MYLSIDLGNKRCGIAVFVEGVVIPKDIVSRINLIKILKKYILEYNTKVVVVGCPYDLYGENKKQLAKTKIFVEKLKNIFPNVEVKGVDERYTSFEAENILKFMGVKETAGRKDAISACLILETYLNSIKC